MFMRNNYSIRIHIADKLICIVYKNQNHLFLFFAPMSSNFSLDPKPGPKILEALGEL